MVRRGGVTGPEINVTASNDT